MMFVLAGNFGNSFAIGASSGVILTTNVLVSIDGTCEVEWCGVVCDREECYRVKGSKVKWCGVGEKCNKAMIS